MKRRERSIACCKAKMYENEITLPRIKFKVRQKIRRATRLLVATFLHLNRIIFKGIAVPWIHIQQVEATLKFLTGMNTGIVAMSGVRDSIKEEAVIIR